MSSHAASTRLRRGPTCWTQLSRASLAPLGTGLRIEALALLLVVLLVGCASTAPTTPAPLNSPQTQALNVTKTLADSINAAVKTAISLRDSGKLSQADTTVIENWAKSAAILDDTIATEIGSADPWTLQKQKILVLLPAFQIPGTSNMDAIIQASINSVRVLIMQLQTQVAN